MATLRDVAAALADTITDAVEGEDGILVVPYFMPVPTLAVVIDIYPASPAQEDAAFGPASSLLAWTVRARLKTADDVSAQGTLLDLMEPWGGISIRGAINSDETLAGNAESVSCDRPTGFSVYEDTGVGGSFGQGRFIGFEQRVRVYSNSEPES